MAEEEKDRAAEPGLGVSPPDPGPTDERRAGSTPPGGEALGQTGEASQAGETSQANQAGQADQADQAVVNAPEANVAAAQSPGEARPNPAARPQRPSGGQPASLRPPGQRALVPLPPATRPASRLEGWPLAFLLIGLAIVGSCHYSALNIADSLSSFGAIAPSNRPSVGILAVEGEIVSSLWVVKTLKRYQEDENVMAVVLRLDTPGGSVAPCQEIVATLRALTKPVVVSMGDVAASGGLYLAVAGDHLMANPGTLTGSIGVIMESIQLAGTMEKLGIKSETITSGQFKDIGSPFREMRPEERAILQKTVMEVYEQFVAEVVKGRPNLTEPQVRQLADGRIFSGQEAARLGLIDELGGLEKAVEKAVILAQGFYDPKNEPNLIYEDGKGGVLQRILSSSQGFLRPAALAPQSGLKFLYRPGL